MKLVFEVGNLEKHALEFAWGQFLGTTCIKVDGVIVQQGRPLSEAEARTSLGMMVNAYTTFVSESTPLLLTRTWELEVGSSEKHHVRIEKARPKLFAGMRRSVFRVYVDGEMLQERFGF